MVKHRGTLLAVLGCLVASGIVAGAALLSSRADASDNAQILKTSQESIESAPEETLTLESIQQISFTDVSEDNPARDAVCYVAYFGIMQGVGNGQFDPDALLTRAETAALLQRMASGATFDNTLSLPFSDIDADAWYADAVRWAAQSGIITGNADGSFTPDRRVTREELAILLWRQAQQMGYEPQSTGNLSAYQDASQVKTFSVQAVSWALEQGLYDALVTDTIHPGLPVSRSQFAQITVAFLAAVEGEPLAAQLAAEDDLAPVASVSAAHHSDIQAAIDSAAEKYGAIGVQVAVIEGGRVTDTFASGWATQGSDPMTADHRMRVASISKVLIGLETMLLREQGGVDLDVSIGEYWGVPAVNPYYPDIPVTIRSMLSHTSSISNLGYDASRSYSAVRSRLAGSSGFSHMQPGAITSWSYNNYAFGVLGQTIELASGMCMDDLLQRDLFDTMGIDAAFAPGDLQNHSHLVTLAYHGGGIARTVSTQRNMHSSDTPGASGSYFAGGLTISAADLGKIAALLANDGKYEGLQLVQPETVELMETINETMLSDGTYQALPLRCQKNIYGRDTLYYHTGSAYGVYNCMSYDPASGDGVVVLTVGASGAKDDRGIYAICGEISTYVYNII